MILKVVFAAILFASSLPSYGATVVEFYNSNLENYFITADTTEAAAIDNGSAGAGWIRTGYNFESGGGSSPVCRFYGSQSPGPNSHFYTVDAGECANLKQIQANTLATEKRWNYEGISFNSTPATNQICPTSSTPIYRAYNNGFARGVDSNHRIAASLTAIQEVVTRGWTNEGVVMCSTVTPMPVLKSSYENKIAAGNVLGSQNMPNHWEGNFVGNFIEIEKNNGSNEGITAGHAYGDFFQDGTYAMVAFSNARDQNDSIQGHVYFYKKNAAGNWVDKTADLLRDQTGCLSPRKVIVADFNGDGKPDVFAACHGLDRVIKAGEHYGEHPRYLLSQPDGTYKNVEEPIICYCHGASAADFGGNGYADVIITNPLDGEQPHFLINNKDGTFAQDYSRLSDDVKPWHFANQTFLYSRPIYSLELIDFNSDGKVDLFIGGNEGVDVNQNWQTSIYLNDGTNNFKSSAIRLPNDIVLGYSLALDIIYKDSKIALLRTSLDYSKLEVQVLSYPSLAVLSTTSVKVMDTLWFTLYNGNIVNSFAENPYLVPF